MLPEYLLHSCYTKVDVDDALLLSALWEGFQLSDDVMGFHLPQLISHHNNCKFLGGDLKLLHTPKHRTYGDYDLYDQAVPHVFYHFSFSGGVSLHLVDQKKEKMTNSGDVRLIFSKSSCCCALKSANSLSDCFMCCLIFSTSSLTLAGVSSQSESEISIPKIRQVLSMPLNLTSIVYLFFLVACQDPVNGYTWIDD